MRHVIVSLIFLSSLIILVYSECPYGHGAGAYDEDDYAHAHGHDHGHGHGQAHGHSHEPEVRPAFKYSREANEQPPVYSDSGHAHDHGHVHSHDHHHDHVHERVIREAQPPQVSASKETKQPEAKKQLKSSDIWVQAIGSTILISLAPFVILFCIPVNDATADAPLLKILLAFAAGGLLGDAFLHLIPHAGHAVDSGSHSHGHGHSHGSGESHEPHDISVGLWVLAGIFAFLLVETVVRVARGDQGHGHGHSHAVVAPATSEKDKKKKKKDKHSDDEDNNDKDNETDPLSKTDDSQSQSEISVAGYLNLAADFAHNFTDGLAIGASCLAGSSIGFMTTLMILFHEVPHEIGDFAILIQSGCSRRKAMWLQLLTAVGALTGTIVSLIAVDLTESASSWILPFTAGGFIYVATVSVIPELLRSPSTLIQSIYQMIAIIISLGFMVVITKFE